MVSFRDSLSPDQPLLFLDPNSESDPDCFGSTYAVALSRDGGFFGNSKMRAFS